MAPTDLLSSTAQAGHRHSPSAMPTESPWGPTLRKVKATTMCEHVMDRRESKVELLKRYEGDGTRDSRMERKE